MAWQVKSSMIILVLNLEKIKILKYVVMFDPLDGSSNIYVNAPIGTIFAIYRRGQRNPNGECTLEDFLQKGSANSCWIHQIYWSIMLLVIQLAMEWLYT